MKNATKSGGPWWENINIAMFISSHDDKKGYKGLDLESPHGYKVDTGQVSRIGIERKSNKQPNMWTWMGLKGSEDHPLISDFAKWHDSMWAV